MMKPSSRQRSRRSTRHYKRHKYSQKHHSKARFVAKGYRQKVNQDEIYAATPAAITVRRLLTLAQLRKHSVYMSDIQSAFPNTPVQPGTTILVQPPPECETNEEVLWKLNKQLSDYATHRKKKRQHHLSAILKPLCLLQLRSDQCMYYDNNITVMVYVDDLLLLGKDNKAQYFLI
eukprot:6467025-Amphidinium_carterae.4